MNRREFAKKIGVVSAVAVAVPAVVLSEPKSGVMYADILELENSFKYDEWQFIQSMKMNVEIIAKHYNVPIHILSEGHGLTIKDNVVEIECDLEPGEYRLEYTL